MATRILTRRRVLQNAALMAGGLAAPLVVRPGSRALGAEGGMTLAWHTNIAPRWLDPQQHDGGATPDNFLNALHDALIKNFRTELYDHPALAERFEFAEDSKGATFKLRQGIKFHDGSPVTAADVKWSYEHYSGAWAKVLHDKTQSVDIADDRTIHFTFKGAFLDFPRLLGTSNVSGAGWIVPAKYYQEVGPDKFLQKPIGAGPYRLVGAEAGTKIEFEAFDDYYRPVHIKRFTIVAVPEAATRVAMLERGEADIIYNVPGELIDRIKNNPKLLLAPVVSGSWWLEFPGFQDPKNPFHDKRVRQAVSLAIDREAINNAESGGMGRVSGNWINDDVQYALDWPKFPKDIAKAKELMKEAGHPNGFNVDWLTPVPNYYSRGERVVSQLQQIGIRARLQVMERGVFLKRQQGGLKEWPGVQIIMNGARIGASWANWYESNFKCGGQLSADRFCVTDVDAKFDRYVASEKPEERQKLATEIQREILENYYTVPVFRHAFVNAIGPRIAAQKWEDVFPTAITTGYAYPWEDLRLKS
jgi:ABC-type transport system substrate-binding protein